MELLGTKPLYNMRKQFEQRGHMEDEKSQSQQSSVKQSTTESMADSSIYREIMKDFDGFNRYYEKDFSKPIDKK